MIIPFETHLIYLTQNGKLYQVDEKYSKRPVSSMERDKDSILINKEQFDVVRAVVLNKDNPFKLTEDAARGFHKLGFITKRELDEFLS